MIGKTIFACTLLISTAALAQGQNPSQPGGNNNLQNQCWDAASNQVRNRMANNQPGGSGGAGAGGGSTVGGAGSGSGSAGSGSGGAAGGGSGTAGSTASRPAGMPNC
jgi:hypothetical protein